MEKRFIFFYFFKKGEEEISEAIAQQTDYWTNMSPDGFLGGLFADKSGGLITFEAGSVEEAERYVSNDPLAKKGLIEQKYIKEWMPA